MKNPFDDFKDHRTREREIPLDSIIQSRDRVMSSIIKGYEKLLEEEVKELVWLVQYNTVIKAYTLAEKVVKEFDYRAEDVEEFCYELDSTDKIPYLITGPAGIYISALCNYAKEEEIHLKLNDLKTQINLLGYRLPVGKKVIVEGNLGDFTGIGLEGGELVLEGNAKNYTGAGMKSGRIRVTKNIGLHTGEWMMGGEIHVGGRVRGMGKIVDGKVYEDEKLIYPRNYRQSNVYY
jgi:formylmethanofuran dehydrogenase subunit C